MVEIFLGQVYKNRSLQRTDTHLSSLLTFCLSFSVLDVSLTPAGKVLKKLGENVTVSLEKNTSSEAKVTWTKVRDCRESNRSGLGSFSHANQTTLLISPG